MTLTEPSLTPPMAPPTVDMAQIFAAHAARAARIEALRPCNKDRLFDGVMAAGLSEKPAHDGRLALADFQRAFEKLPVEQREALILVGASGFAYEEAADMCGVAVGTIKSRANRGRKRLTELLGMADGEDPVITDAATASVMASSPQQG